MSQAILFLRQLASIFSCSRRNSSDACTDLKRVSRVATKHGNKIGKLRGNRSDVSTELDSADSALVSTSGSDTEVSSLRSRAWKPSNAKPPPGLSLEPDLEPQACGRNESQKHVTNRRLSTETKICRPQTTNRDRKLEECLRAITSSPENELASSLGEVLKRQIQREQNGHLQSLEKILGKLSPEDAAIVKAALKTKGVSHDSMRALARANITEENTLRSNLQKLADIDAKRIFMVRKINKLGLSSPDFLKAYFSKFGRVENVYVTHNVDKRNLQEDPQARPTIRPAGLGFVVMGEVEDVENIFQQGLDHTISDVQISISVFEHHNPREAVRNSPRDRRIKQCDPARQGEEKFTFPWVANISEDNTLRANLRKMADIDAGRIFMVRKINKLGLNSSRLLKFYFTRFGRVSEVFISHSIDRGPAENPYPKPHIRPAKIGFIVMEKPEHVAAAFQSGVEQTVCGVNIVLANYEHQAPTEATNDGNELETSISEEPANSNEVLEAPIFEEPTDSYELQASICEDPTDSNEIETSISELPK